MHINKCRCGYMYIIVRNTEDGVSESVLIEMSGNHGHID